MIEHSLRHGGLLINILKEIKGKQEDLQIIIFSTDQEHSRKSKALVNGQANIYSYEKIDDFPYNFLPIDVRGVNSLDFACNY